MGNKHLSAIFTLVKRKCSINLCFHKHSKYFIYFRYNITLVLKRRAKHKTGLEKATCIRTVGPCTPEIVPEFISFTKGSNSTEIMVYVSKVPEYLHNGPNFEYVISKQTDERSVNFRLRTKNSMGWCRDSKIVSIPYDFEGTYLHFDVLYFKLNVANRLKVSVLFFQNSL